MALKKSYKGPAKGNVTFGWSVDNTVVNAIKKAEKTLREGGALAPRKTIKHLPAIMAATALKSVVADLDENVARQKGANSNGYSLHLTTLEAAKQYVAKVLENPCCDTQYRILCRLRGVQPKPKAVSVDPGF